MSLISGSAPFRTGKYLETCAHCACCRGWENHRTNSQAASCFCGVVFVMLTLAPYKSIAGAGVADSWGTGAMVHSAGPDALEATAFA